MERKRKKLFEAIVAIVVALAFVMPAASSISSPDATQTCGMIYVDDDADPDWYDATHVRTIQEGVNNATAGDTIFVFNGTYANVVVNKRVDLVGESKEGVIIDGDGVGNVIKVVANYVNITTLLVHNGGSTGSSIRLAASYATIANCNTYGSYFGISLFWESNNNLIINCDIHDNREGGILISGVPSSNNIITDCDIHNNYRGVMIDSGSNNIVYRNIFRDNKYQNAWDEWPGNTWDNGAVGNYWDDYYGKDQDGDGIGDKPYYIPGVGGSRDRYPLMDPTDMTPPKTTCELEGDKEGDVYIGKVTVTLLSEDILSGVNYTKYKIDDGIWMNYTEPFVVSDNSNHTLYFYSVDNAGNVEDKKQCEFTVKCIMVDIKGGLGITIIFDNIGETDIIGLEYNLTLDQGLIIIPPGGTTNGTVDVAIPAGEKVPVRVPVLGFGKPNVIVTADPAEGTADALIFFIFVVRI